MSGLLARDAWGGLGGQAEQAWAAWENPQPPRSCHLRCIQPLSLLHLEASALGFTLLLRLSKVGEKGTDEETAVGKGSVGVGCGGYVGTMEKGGPLDWVTYL